MISKKTIVADGSTNNFLSDFIIKSEEYCRVYAYIYDKEGVNGDLQDPSKPYSFPSNLYVRTTNLPNPNKDLVVGKDWALYNNSINFYETPQDNTQIYIEVSSTLDDFTTPFIQGAIEQAIQEADRAKIEADSAKVEADKAKVEADKAKVEADNAGNSVVIAKNEADKAVSEATNAKNEADRAKVEADRATVDISGIKQDIVTTNQEVAKKADKTYVDTRLLSYAGADIVQEVNSNKQEIDTVRQELVTTNQELTTKAEQSYVNSEIIKVRNEIPSLSKLPIYSYRGNTLQVLPADKAYRGYYLSYYGIQNKELGQSMPDLDLEVGTVLAIDNADINDNILVKARNGETIGGAISTNLPSESVLYIVKSGPKEWTQVLSGYFAPSQSALVNMIKYELRDVLGGGGDGDLTIVGDDDVVNIGMNNLKFDSTIVEDDPDDIKKVSLKPYTTVEFLDKDDLAGSSKAVKANKLKFLPPLQGFSDPDNQLGAIVELKHNQFEPAKAPGYLAYLNESEDIVGRISPIDISAKRATLWFDDVIVPSGPFIATNKANKSISLQEWDEKDPNVTGGDAFLVAFRLAMRGKAPEDGFVSIYFVERSSGYPAEDANGLPMGAQRKYKQGDDLGVIELVDIILAKGLKEYQCVVEHSFARDTIVAEDRTEGASGIMIQSITGDEKTGDALLQFENDILKNIEVSSHYNGEDIFSMAWLFNQNIPLSNLNAGEGDTMEDGFHLYNPTNIKAGFENSTLTIADNGTDLAYFNFGKIFTAERTKMLRNKDIKVSATLVDKQNAFRISLVSWTGTPDNFTKKIITDISNSNPVLEPNWTIVDSLFISEDVVAGEHTVSKTFSIPSTANNFAFIMYPTSKQIPISLKVNSFKGDVLNPFTGYVVNIPEEYAESFLAYSDKHARFSTGLPSGYASYRFTINKAETKLPAGIKVKGGADIVLAPNWTIGMNSGAEGDLKFNRGGNAIISTTVNAFSGESVPDGGTSTITLWWAEKQSDGSFRKIKPSEITHTLKKGEANVSLSLPSFEYLARTNDEIRLLATSNISDGAYVQTSKSNVNLTDTLIDFDEIAFVKRQISNNRKYTDDELQKLTTEFDNKLDDKAGIVVMNNELAKKADLTVMNSELNKKADKTAMTNALKDKASLSANQTFNGYNTFAKQCTLKNNALLYGHFIDGTAHPLIGMDVNNRIKLGQNNIDMHALSNVSFDNYAPSTAIVPSSPNHLTNKAYVDSVAGGGLKVVASSLGTNGYIKYSNGFIMQWGNTASDVSTVHFPIAFPTQCLLVIPSPQFNGGGVNGTFSYVSSQTTTSFSVREKHPQVHMHWYAIGK